MFKGLEKRNKIKTFKKFLNQNTQENTQLGESVLEHLKEQNVSSKE